MWSCLKFGVEIDMLSDEFDRHPIWMRWEIIMLSTNDVSHSHYDGLLSRFYANNSLLPCTCSISDSAHGISDPMAYKVPVQLRALTTS